MIDETLPSEDIEAPEAYQSLAAPLQPRLPPASAYTDGARQAALYVSGEKVICNDGASSGTGDISVFLAYKRHPAIARHLASAHLGSADEEAAFMIPLS